MSGKVTSLTFLRLMGPVLAARTSSTTSAWVWARPWASSAPCRTSRCSTAASEAPATTSASFSAHFGPFSHFLGCGRRPEAGQRRGGGRQLRPRPRRKPQHQPEALTMLFFVTSHFFFKTITNFQSWVIPRENKKDELAQLWNSFENVNIGDLFSKMGHSIFAILTFCVESSPENVT